MASKIKIKGVKIRRVWRPFKLCLQTHNAFLEMEAQPSEGFSRRVRGGAIFKNKEGKAQTVNTERYIEKLEMFIQTLRQKIIAKRDQWLIQDVSFKRQTRYATQRAK